MVNCLEYVWIGGNQELRSKIRVYYNAIDNDIQNVPRWNYDGSSTGQASGDDSEVILVPRKLYPNPFLGYGSYLVLCDTYTPLGVSTTTNTRQFALERFQQSPEQEPWFGLEQEYFLINPTTKKPLGFPLHGLPNPQGQYYCSVGTENAFGRYIAEQHMQFCLHAGIRISGINAEVAPGQWEFQVGPCEGIESGDQLWMARYILNRIAESHGMFVNYEPKPLEGDWNGSGCHMNYSTKNMREGNGTKEGLDYIMEAIELLEVTHENHMNVYGEGNDKRMTGEHETANYKIFTYGVANRGASVRIGNETHRDKKGYFEDRRPSSNCDPYLVTKIILETVME